VAYCPLPAFRLLRLFYPSCRRSWSPSLDADSLLAFYDHCALYFCSLLLRSIRPFKVALCFQPPTLSHLPLSTGFRRSTIALTSGRLLAFTSKAPVACEDLA
jgi:hypothetical protein